MSRLNSLSRALRKLLLLKNILLSFELTWTEENKSRTDVCLGRVSERERGWEEARRKIGLAFSFRNDVALLVVEIMNTIVDTSAL